MWREATQGRRKMVRVQHGCRVLTADKVFLRLRESVNRLTTSCKCLLFSPTKCISGKLQPDQLICLKYCCGDPVRADKKMKENGLCSGFEITRWGKRAGGRMVELGGGGSLALPFLRIQLCFIVN